MATLIELDKKLFKQLHKLMGKNIVFDYFWKLASVYLVYMLPIFLVLNWFFNSQTREASLRGTVSGMFGWLVLTPLISKLWYCPRPFTEITNNKEVVFHRPDYSFPSDHAIFAFAIASGFYLAGYTTLGSILYSVAFLISFSRVVVGVHYLLDCVVGAFIGIGLSYLAWHYQGNFDSLIVKPIFAIAKWLHMG